ncbi:MAG: aminotransferase, partial [Microbacteriaceae bacterium]
PLGLADARATARRLVEEAGVVSIPVSAFVRADQQESYGSLLRFAYCKRPAVIAEAAASVGAFRA